MSEDENEMVTIEVPLQWAKDTVGDVSELHEGGDAIVYRSCKAALDARKSLYERWRERAGLPWINDGQVMDAVKLPTGRRLMAAAPELLGALLKLTAAYEKHVIVGTRFHDGHYTKIAIKLALPADVAKEQLGE